MSHSRASIRAAACALAALTIVCLASGPAAAETFNLDVHAYCPVTNCGHPSYGAYVQYIRQVIEEINVQWQPNGISFRPGYIPVPLATPDYLAARCNDVDPNDGIDESAYFQDWRQNVAANKPKRISILLNYAAKAQDSRMCCSELPTNPGIPAESLFGILCDTGRSSYDLGAVLAHELGHHFCLCHTHGWNKSTDSPMDTADWVQANDGALDWSGDDNTQCEVYDTSGDPGWEEPYDGNGDGVADPGRDRQSDGSYVLDHEFCGVVQQPWVDAGSPHGQYCDLNCSSTFTGWPLPFDPNTDPTDQPVQAMAMSYWGTGCVGPYVRYGHRQEAFSPDSSLKIAKCYLDYRLGVLEDVCLTKGGDTDHDGWCNQEDNCPGARNTAQTDSDHDGVGDACDISVVDPGPSTDIDADTLGALLDMDDDGDGCADIADQHPDDASLPIGSTFSALCGWGVVPDYGFEGLDTDGDGKLNCEDYDDDNDGICDEGGPLEASVSGVPPGGCVAGPYGADPCPLEAGDGCHPLGGTCPPIWKTCQGSSCDPFFLQMTSIVSPTEFVALPGKFTIYNETLYLAPLAGRTLSETAQVLNGDFAAAAQPGPIMLSSGGGTAAASSSGSPSIAPGDPVQLEIRSRVDGSLVAVVAQFVAGDAALGDVTRGRFLAISLQQNPGPPTVAATFAIGHDPAGAPMYDPDDDGTPAADDNCLMAYNPMQTDADGDGFGNMCDADLDNDLVVTSADLAMVQACEGADLTLSMPLAEPLSLQGRELPPNPCGGTGPCPAYDLARGCRAADLDENGLVDAADTSIARAALSTQPGPSARGNPADLCGTVTCDDGDPCTEDRCVPQSGQCYHAPVTCEDHDACTIDTCDPGTGACLNTPLTCDDANGCTADSCDPGAGCQFDPVADGATCSDGDACTTFDTCRAGVCAPGAPATCNDGDPCTVDACDPSSGQCVVAGATCDDGNPCTVDTCSGRTGACSYTSLGDGTGCDDGDACTLGETCQAGACAPASAVSCDDADLCTTDTCDPATGLCAHPPLSCDDGDTCTSDSCDPGTGRCLYHTMAFFDVEPVRFIDRITLAWSPTPPAPHWNSYRGTIPPGLLASRPAGAEYDHVCFDSADLAADGPTRTLEYADPAAGWAFYYLVSEEEACGEGGVGYSSSFAPRPMPFPCPTPP